MKNKEIRKDCWSCSQCCKNTVLKLSKDEALRILQDGNINYVFQSWGENKQIFSTNDLIIDDPSREVILQFVWSCPQLSRVGQCNIYNKRPQVCRDYELNSLHCKSNRKIAINNIIASME